MKTLEKILLQACAYTVAIMLAFFTLAAAFGVDTVLTLFNLFICILIGATISAASLIFKIKGLKIWFKVPIHYAALLAVFIPFLYISIPEFMERPAAVFVAIIIYTIFYAIAAGATVGIKKLVGYLDTKLEKNDKSKKNQKKQSKTYTPRYK